MCIPEIDPKSILSFWISIFSFIFGDLGGGGGEGRRACRISGKSQNSTSLYQAQNFLGFVIGICLKITKIIQNSYFD